MKRYDTVEPLAGLVEDRAGEWVRFADIPDGFTAEERDLIRELAWAHVAGCALTPIEDPHARWELAGVVARKLGEARAWVIGGGGSLTPGDNPAPMFTPEETGAFLYACAEMARRPDSTAAYWEGMARRAGGYPFGPPDPNGDKARALAEGAE